MIRRIALSVAVLTTVLGGCAATDTSQPSQEGQEGQEGPAGVKPNVILFLGDGMGVSTVTAARILQGQMRGDPGEDNYLGFEKFDNVALVKTYTTDYQVSDSAGTMTAIMTGKKTRSGVISVGPDADRGDCAATSRHAVPTLLEDVERRGYRTGVISTARITHATPAATYAHAPERNWEVDVNVPEDVRDQCADIARQLVEFDVGDGVDLALGGGRAMFLPQAETDPEYADTNGRRGDGRNLIDEWLAKDPSRQYVWHREGFDDLKPRAGQIIGLFEPSHLQFEVDRQADPAGEPSLAQMTAFAIEHLAGDTGYLLVVEGGRIDHAHHGGNAYRALVDTIAFAQAVDTAVAATDPRDTLILVTADHSHTLTISGYPSRGNPILGYAAIAGEPCRTARVSLTRPWAT